jgi:hypothetical protein
VSGKALLGRQADALAAKMAFAQDGVLAMHVLEQIQA